MTAIVSWLIALELSSLAVLPLTLTTLRSLRADHGYPFAKVLGVALLGYALWLSVSLHVLPNTFLSLVVLLTLLGLNAWVARGKVTLRFIRAHWSTVLACEAAFLTVFLLWAWVKAHDPNIAGGEHPMDMAFLSASYRAQSLPPADPFLLGYSINYYYLGHYLFAALAKLARVLPPVGYNLAQVTVVALSFTCALSLGRNLTGRWAYGLLSAFALTLFGNLVGVLDWLYALNIGSPSFWQYLGIDAGAVGYTQPYLSPTGLPGEPMWWFRASRIIPRTINEFPFFTFLIGELHPHMSAVPFKLLILAAALALLTDQNLSLRHYWLLPFLTGLMGPVNPWDLPVFWMLVAVVLHLRVRQSSANWQRALAKTVVLSSGLLAVSLLLFLPFYLGYQAPPVKGLALVPPFEKTRLLHFGLMFGFFAYVIAGLLTVILAARWRNLRDASRQLKALVGLGAVSVAVAVWLGWRTAALAGVGLALILPLVLRRRRVSDEKERFALLLMALALGLIFACEFVFIRDNNNSRVNTVFKFYHTAWISFSVAAGYAVHLCARGFRRFQRHLWLTGLSALILASLTYPFLALLTKPRWESQPTLDGLAWMAESAPGDLAVIRWFWERPQGQPVILEAGGEDWRIPARIACNTGLQTLNGWPTHEYAWRWDSIWSIWPPRPYLIQQMYGSRDPDELIQLLMEYDVRYVVFGLLERETYGEAAEKVFRQALPLILDVDGTRLYGMP